MSTETPTTPTPEPTIEPSVTEQPTEAGTAREAAKYRHQLREAESARDTLAEQLTAARRALAEQILTAGVDIDGRVMRPAIPDDVFSLGGLDVASLYGEDGTLDTDALAEAARGLHATRPALFEPAHRAVLGPYVPPEGKAPSGTLGGMTWAQALRPE